MLPNECGECLHNHQDMYLYCGHQGAGKGGIVPEVRICPANGRPEWCPLGDAEGFKPVPCPGPGVVAIQYDGLDKIDELKQDLFFDILSLSPALDHAKKINEIIRVVNLLTEIAIERRMR